MADYMKIALELGHEALAAQEVPVGCVFVIDDTIIAKARNTVNETRNPTRHAEINCIDMFLDYCTENSIDYKSKFKDVSVYVTVEPCIMCAAALNSVGIKEVFYGCANDRFGGETVLDVGKFFTNKYSVKSGLFADKAMELLKLFYKGTNPLAPESKAKKKYIIN